MFDGDDKLFKEIVSKSVNYAEYGCGDSTNWVFHKTSCNIMSVDSSQNWINAVFDQCDKNDRLKLHFSNLGDIGDWGTPLSYDFIDNFDDYFNWLWMQGINHDVILVDGRFRVACFLTCLLHAKNGTFIIFDDYTNRRKYHIVERFLKPLKTCGRQALFVVKNDQIYDKVEIKNMINQFRVVFD